MADFEMLATPRKGPPDLEERDYYGQHTPLTIQFEDIIGEHEDYHTYSFVWISSYKCFDVCNALCYGLATLCCGFCAALWAGIEVASTFFFYIWCGTPSFKAFDVTCLLPKNFCRQCVECTCHPCCATLSRQIGESSKR